MAKKFWNKQRKEIFSTVLLIASAVLFYNVFSELVTMSPIAELGLGVGLIFIAVYFFGGK